jgi:protein-L-isoaspartate(D-aspartate) O-methyltransferase
MNIEQARFNMIEQQIRPWDVLDKGVLGLLAVVRREDFVPAAWRTLAFVDTEVPLGEGECMLPPRVEARMLQDLQVQRHERVLEIGTGSGFMAALLGHRAQSVISLEIKPALAKTATENLRRSGASNVRPTARTAMPAKARSTRSCCPARSPRCPKNCSSNSSRAAAWWRSKATSR